MRIGFGRQNVTPAPGCYLSGQPIAVKAVGVESDLFATAMAAIDDNGATIVLVGCDIITVNNQTAETLRRRAASELGLDADRVILCATHTHSGPNGQELFGLKTDNAYIARFNDGVIAAIRDALETARPARLKIAAGTLPGLAFNRRFLMSDGTIETHPLKNNPHIVRPDGPDAADLRVLAAETQEGEILGAAMIFGCHATVMERANDRISADFPGKAATALSEKLGGAPVLFLQGACGDICQVNPLDPTRRELGASWTKHMGDALAEKAAKLLRTASTPADGPLRVLTRSVTVSRREIDPDTLRWAKNHRDAAAPTPVLSDYGAENFSVALSLESFLKTPFWADFYAREIQTLEKSRAESPELSFAIKVLAGDDWAMVTLPCELFVAWQNKIQANSPFPFTAVVELANGWNGYVPTREAFARPGGYETKDLSSTFLSPDAGEKIYALVMETLAAARHVS